MSLTPLSSGLFFSAVLFVLGLLALLARRNLIFALMAIEIMLNAGGLAFISAAAAWGQADGQVMYFIVLAVAASEVSVGLALVLRLDQQRQTLDTDAASDLRG